MKDQSFKQMIASCLVKDPSKRPSTKKLLKHSFFKQARSSDYIVRTLLDGLPPLGDRIKALKKKEEDMLAQKEMPDGEKEELSQNEYKRGISTWNFNLEDVKAQASLIPDDEMFEKDHGVGIDGQEETDLSSSNGASSLIDSTGKCIKSQYEKLEEEISSISSLCQVDNTENKASRVPDTEAPNTVAQNSSIPLHHRRATSSACTYKLEIPAIITDSFRSPKQQEIISIHDAPLSTDSVEETMSDTTPRTLKGSSANSEEIASRIPVIQQKGRFKVTSENVDIEKAASSHGSIPKSQSLQVITPSPMISSPTGYQIPTNPNKSLFSLLQSFLQTNITQRESIMKIMKQIAYGDFNANYTIDGTSTSVATIEKSLLELAHDKEKELLQEIATLQLRLINTQEEFQRLKADNIHMNS